MTTSAVLIVASAMGIMGLAAMVTPERFLKVTGSQVLNRNGRNEVRAVYGGFGMAMSGILVCALLVDEYRSGILLCMAMALFGMASGRVISAIFDRGISPLMAGIAAFEAVGGLSLFWAM